MTIFMTNYSDLEVDFGSEENASIVYATITVDNEVNFLTCEFCDFLPLLTQLVFLLFSSSMSSAVATR